MNKGKLIILGMIIVYFVLLYNFPIVMIIITAIFCYIWFSTDSKTNSSSRWIDGYHKKDGTYVEGHWRKK